MAKKPPTKYPSSPERAAEIAAETKTALESSRKSEQDRIARVGSAGVKGTERTAATVDANPGVKFTKTDEIAAPKKKSKPKKSRAVVRNPETGRAERPTPVLLGAPVTTRSADPIIKKFKKGNLVTVKPRKQRKQTPILAPKIGQAGVVGGATVRVTPDNLTQVYEEKRRTELPTAGPAVMQSAGRPAVTEAVMPRTLRGSQSGKNLGGFAGKHEDVSKVAHEALGHLQTLSTTQKGTPEHHAAHEAFNVAHATLGQIGHKTLHRLMGLGRTIVEQHHGEDIVGKALKLHKGHVLGSLEQGKIAEQARSGRSGREKKGQ
ncbi:hypothetical protein UFOVP964_70 [uncultured Caudovirales phage]|uniref:Uncharacterized protein n=1 Tax=uncultured Caudovirales phage TaxID=2100421 RepID=A0A6J5PBY8_9CAUD|nr:hypothetical protein UFOVP854_70 [uncultured Caudovirales phage]CAB4174652.1 hypothetical protein UFOVP964_70 [uncultured Caudovirales phage]CAB4179382.1 hypothetical protein UFOVP1034_88 [uncultured Caudovirales phage]CAB4189132.1 hypothetical protein UFOVP1177_88 [uncultured Caudovirales phage]CAB4193414.1 hypothetical protein UFOVP1243_75 [uncultured Caudovirales phage]